tara:strand:+ start:139 stop:471 length:333 start_codon:yes stop_codon:yes gene_type:complete
MSEQVQKFVDDLANGNNAEAGEAFKDALRDKVASALDNARQDIAKNIFNGVDAEAHSDPKPGVIDPSDRTDKIFDDQGQEIQFTPNENPQPEAEAPQAPVEAEAPADETQ